MALRIAHLQPVFLPLRTGLQQVREVIDQRKELSVKLGGQSYAKRENGRRLSICVMNSRLIRFGHVKMRLSGR